MNTSFKTPSQRVDEMIEMLDKMLEMAKSMYSEDCIHFSNFLAEEKIT